MIHWLVWTSNAAKTFDELISVWVIIKRCQPYIIEEKDLRWGVNYSRQCYPSLFGVRLLEEDPYGNCLHLLSTTVHGREETQGK